jgi:hypothetical protein
MASLAKEALTLSIDGVFSGGLEYLMGGGRDAAQPTVRRPPT